MKIKLFFPAWPPQKEKFYLLTIDEWIGLQMAIPRSEMEKVSLWWLTYE